MEILQETIVNGIISVLVVLIGLAFSGIREFILSKAEEIQAKTTAEEWELIQNLARHAVDATEQIAKYHEIKGHQKLNYAMARLNEGLEENGLVVTDTQKMTLIESLVKEMNDTKATIDKITGDQ